MAGLVRLVQQQQQQRRALLLLAQQQHLLLLLLLLLSSASLFCSCLHRGGSPSNFRLLNMWLNEGSTFPEVDSGVSAVPSGGALGGLQEGPLIRGWTKLPVAACRLETVASGAAPPVGPFPALLTLNSRGQVQAFEPVVIVNLCPMEGSSGDALYHVACKEVKEFDPRHMLSRPTPDLTFRLSLEENTISGILPSLVASSLKTFLARKEFRGTNPIVPMLKWLTERRKNKEDYSISCHDNRFRQKNPQLSYTSFWGELLQATYEYRGTDESALPSLSST